MQPKPAKVKTFAGKSAKSSNAAYRPQKAPARAVLKAKVARLGLTLFLVSSSAPLIALAYIKYQQQFLNPSVALVLGGSPERERFAAQFALDHPNVDIWISSGSNPEYAQWVFDEAHVPANQWHLDYKAVDTVTNFTTLVDELEAKQIDQVYLITSDYHMRRASIVAQIILGSQGIRFKPIAIKTQQKPEQPETPLRELRDGARSLLWVITGKTGLEWHNPQSSAATRQNSN